MTKRDINYLLKKYKPNKLVEGEKWSKEKEKKRKELYRLNQRYFLFDSLNSQHLRLKGISKRRAKHLIKKIDFQQGKWTEEQTIIMIMLFVKLTENRSRRFQEYNYILAKAGVDYEAFLNFVLRIASP